MANMLQLPSYMEDFLNSLVDSGRKPGTIKQYSSDLKPFVSWMDKYKNDTSLDSFQSLTITDIGPYFEELKNAGYTAATLRRFGTVLNRLRRFYGFEPLGVIHEVTFSEPLRNLTESDFINDLEFRKLIKAIRFVDPDAINKAASRSVLIDRNLAIVFLMRFYGLTPSEIHLMSMKDLNLAQGTLMIRELPILIKEEHIKPLRTYIHSIPELFRPQYGSHQPVFVAFNNVSMTFQYDYGIGQPKRLSVRAIQRMLLKEMDKAGLRGLSALNLRNSAILDALYDETNTSEKLVTYFGLSNAFSLRRYIEFKNRE